MGLIAMVTPIVVLGAKTDVYSRLSSSGERGFSATFDSIRPSVTHGILIEFQLHGHGELSRAYWRLVPFRSV